MRGGARGCTRVHDGHRAPPWRAGVHEGCALKGVHPLSCTLPTPLQLVEFEKEIVHPLAGFFPTAGRLPSPRAQAAPPALRRRHSRRHTAQRQAPRRLAPTPSPRTNVRDRKDMGRGERRRLTLDTAGAIRAPSVERRPGSRRQGHRGDPLRDSGTGDSDRGASGELGSADRLKESRA